MRVLLVGNYAPDRQQSMQRYASLLSESLASENLQLTILRPPALLTKLHGLPRNLYKWLGYIDKYLLFPPLLRLRASGFDLIHICDHSNVVYHPWTGNTPFLITCHDMLAIRGAIGDDEVFCDSTWMGRYLQRWILRSLSTAPFVAFDSLFTRNDFLRLTRRRPGADLPVILLPLNSPFSSVTQQELLCKTHPDLLQTPFLLMVGSSHPRKNREAAIRLLKQLGASWDGLLVVAGAELSAGQRALASKSAVTTRIRQIPNPNHNLLNALYVHAHALLFPSHAEGFGWPVIEAQQCDCPVICSNVTSVPEVAGSGAIVCGPDDLPAMASAVLRLADPSERRQLIAAGRTNILRFDVDQFRDKYLAFYRHIQPFSF